MPKVEKIFDLDIFRLREAKTPEDLHNNIIGLISCSLNIKNIDENNTYKIPVKFNNHEIYIFIKPNRRHYKFYISDINVQHITCLSLSINPEHKPLSGHISMVTTSDDINCNIPKTKAGTWLVKFANAFFCSIGIRRVNLSDVSRIPCIDTEESDSTGKRELIQARFFLLRIFNGTLTSWYENFGYKYHPKNIEFDDGTILSSDEAISMFRKDIKNLYQFLMSNWLESLNNKYLITTSDKDLKKIFESVKKVVKKYDPQMFETLSAYMSYLWKENCRSYIDIERFLLYIGSQSQEIRKLFKWANLIYRIDLFASTTHMVLENSCI